MADGLVIATDKAPGTTCLIPVDGAGEWQVWNIHKETSVGYLSFRSFLEHEVAIREPVATLAEARSLVERANLGDRVATWRLSRVTADDAVPFLVELMDGQWEHAAARSLSRIGTSEAMDALVRSGSRTAVRALMWDGSERARDALAECRAVVELSLLGDPRGVELAVREIEERDPAISGDAELTRLRTAVGVLGRSREPRFAEVLLPLRFGDTEKESALSVALALIELRVPDGRTRLAELAASDDPIGGRARHLLQRVDDGYLA
jgi:HEAT repeat protein